MSEPLIRRTDSVSINQEVYLNECLKERLIPFINEHHRDGKYIFWPDLASSHYAKSVVSWMDQNINYVAKDINPPNVPQARPIETFWAQLSQMVYEDGWQAKTERQLRPRIRQKISQIQIEYLQRLMGGVKTKLRKIADEGVFGLFSKLKINDK
jgi:hypothetical protein